MSPDQQRPPQSTGAAIRSLAPFLHAFRVCYINSSAPGRIIYLLFYDSASA